MYLFVEYSQFLLDKPKIIFRLGTFGAIAEYGAEKKVSQNSSVSAAVMLGVPSGVMLKLKYLIIIQHISTLLVSFYYVLNLMIPSETLHFYCLDGPAQHSP